MSRDGYRLLLIAAVILAAVISVNAQDMRNINCINQYYHNWTEGVYDVRTANDYTYLACGYEGLRILDTSNPAAVREVGHLVYTEAVCLAIYGNYLYLGVYPSGIRVFDISNPEAVVDLGEIAVTGARVIRIHDDYAYVCNYGDMYILSLANPASPIQVWESPELIYAADVALQDNMAYIACESRGLKVLDVTDPSSPAVVDSFGTTHEFQGIAVSGNYAYVAAFDGGFEVIDLTTMQLASEIDTLVFGFDVSVDGDYAYYSYGDPDCPLAIIDISDPVNPQITSIYYPPEDIWNFTLVDDKVYVADNCHGLRVVDVSDQFEPFETFTYNDYGHDAKVKVYNDLAILTQDYRFQIIDISDLANPVELGFYDMTWAVQEAEIVGSTAFLVQTANPVLTAIDLESPDLFDVIGTLSVESNFAVSNMEIYDHYAFLDYVRGILIVDIADPANMQEVGMIDEPSGIMLFDICGSHLYYQACNHQVKLIDISDPFNPITLATDSQFHYMTQMEATEDRFYASWNRYVYVYDMSDLDNWVPRDTMELLDAGRSLADLEIRDQYLYATSWDDGFRVFDITDISSPQLVAYSDTPGYTRGLCLLDNVAIIADMTNLGFYDISSITGIDDNAVNIPQQFALLANYPNPFNSSTNIRFEMPSGGIVQISVYDALGRQVKDLADYRAEAGNHVINWDGTDGSGQTVASGRYYIRATAEGQVQSLPVTFLK